MPQPPRNGTSPSGRYGPYGELLFFKFLQERADCQLSGSWFGLGPASQSEAVKACALVKVMHMMAKNKKRGFPSFRKTKIKAMKKEDEESVHLNCHYPASFGWRHHARNVGETPRNQSFQETPQRSKSKSSKYPGKKKLKAWVRDKNPTRGVVMFVTRERKNSTCSSCAQKGKIVRDW